MAPIRLKNTAQKPSEFGVAAYDGFRSKRLMANHSDEPNP
jgi:hypothetical protein